MACARGFLLVLATQKFLFFFITRVSTLERYQVIKMPKEEHEGVVCLMTRKCKRLLSSIVEEPVSASGGSSCVCLSQSPDQLRLIRKNIFLVHRQESWTKIGTSLASSPFFWCPM